VLTNSKIDATSVSSANDLYLNASGTLTITASTLVSSGMSLWAAGAISVSS